MPLLQNGKVIDENMGAIKEDSSVEMFAPMLEGMLKQVSDVVGGTTKVEFGINIVKE